MTKEEALYKVKGYLTDIIPVENYSEVEEIIKALKQEPCEDCISRQDAINEIKNVFDDVLCCNVSVRKGLPEAVRRIEMMPSTDRPTGKWTEIENGEYLCSNCSRITIGYPPNYCPNCRSYNGGGEE